LSCDRGFEAKEQIRRRGVGLDTTLQRTKHVAHAPRGRQDDVHRLFGDGQFAITQLVEQVFSQMTQRDEFGRIEKTGTALDGMKATENVVQQAVVIRALFQVDQLVIHTRQQIRRFDQEILEQVFHPTKIAHRKLLPQKPRLSSRSST
jgi:hypothetical protein